MVGKLVVVNDLVAVVNLLEIGRQLIRRRNSAKGCESRQSRSAHLAGSQ